MKFYIILIFFIIILIGFSYECKLENYNTNLYEDGFLFFNKRLPENEVLDYLPKGYMFLNYKYEIKGCTISTFHRDVTSSKYTFKTKYPTYTYAVYNNTNNLISLCPGSHMQVPFLFDCPKIIKSKEKTNSILFNCDIVHAGDLLEYPNKERNLIQYKICHKEDAHLLSHLNNINKKVVDDCSNFNYIYELFLRKSSICFSYIINNWFTKYLQENQNNFINNI